MADRVHDVVNAFMLSSDFLEGKALVEQLKDELLSDASLAYIDRQLAHAEKGSPLHNLLLLKGRALHDCRDMSVNYAFARMLFEVDPGDVSPEVAQRIAAARSPEEIERLAHERPDLLAQVRSVVVRTQFQNGLKEELLGKVYPSGTSRRAEACSMMLRLCDRRIDPQTWAEIAGELANAITAASNGSRESYEAALPFYRGALEVLGAGPNQAQRASAHFGLGRALASLATNDAELAEGISHLEQALTLRVRGADAPQWANAHHAIAAALREWRGAGRADKLKSAIAHAAQSLDAYAMLNADAAGLAAHRTFELACAELALLIAPKDDASGRERLKPECDGRTWHVAARFDSASGTKEEWLLDGQSLALGTDLMLTTTHPCAQDMPFYGMFVARRSSLAAMVTNGTVTFDVMCETERDAVYRWSIADDFGIEDQEGIGRIVRGASALLRIEYIAHDRLDAQQRDAWRRRFEAAAPLRSPAPEAPRDPRADQAEIESRLQRLQSIPSAPIDDPASLCSTMLSGIRYLEDGHLWATVLLLCGLHVVRAPQPTAEAREFAIKTMRRALEHYASGTAAWANAATAIARQLMSRTHGDVSVDLAHAKAGFVAAATIFAREEDYGQLASALQGCGDALARLANSPKEMLGALDAYIEALELRPRERDGVGWAETTLAIGDVCLAAYRATHDLASLEQASAAFDRVLEALASDPQFSGTDRSVGQMMTWAISRLNEIDREGIPEPRMPPGFRDRETRGEILYLRPLITAKSLGLPNRFVARELFAVQFDVEPEVLTLDSVLYRALGERFIVTAIGGRSDGLGATRIYSVGGESWKEVALLQFDRANLILLVPHDSPGVRWEIETCAARGLLDRVLFLMPPESQFSDVGKLWTGGAALLRSFNLRAPEWDRNGCFIRFAADGSVAQTIPFDVVWTNELAPRIEPLLGTSRRAGGAPRSPEAAVAPPALALVQPAVQQRIDLDQGLTSAP